MILKENSTHKAVRENGKINLYLKGIAFDPSIFTKEDKAKYPHWFKDEFIDVVDHEEDLLAIFGRLDENNRINMNES